MVSPGQEGESRQEDLHSLQEQLNDPDIQPSLLNVLQLHALQYDPDPYVRQEAFRSLEGSVEKDPLGHDTPVKAAFIHVLKYDPSEYLRSIALRVLAPHVEKAPLGHNTPVKAAFVWRLNEAASDYFLHRETCKEVLEGLKNHTADPGVRAALLVVGHHHSEVIKNTFQVEDSTVKAELLHTLQHNPDPNVRAAAAIHLEWHRNNEYSSGSNQVRDALLHTLQHDPDPNVRVQAVGSLEASVEVGQLGDDTPVQAAFLEVLTNIALEPMLRGAVVPKLLHRLETTRFGSDTPVQAAFLTLWQHESDRGIRERMQPGIDYCRSDPGFVDALEGRSR